MGVERPVPFLVPRSLGRARIAARRGRWALAAAAVVVSLVAVGGPGPAAGRPLAPAPAPLTLAEAEPVFVELEPLTIPVVHRNRLVKQVTFMLTLEVSGPEAEAEVAKKMPYLRDAFLKRLHRLARWNPLGAQSFDAAVVKRRLLADSERVLGPGVVRAILVQGVFEQPVR